MLFGLIACAVQHGPVYLKNGKKYGIVSGNFTDRWYDYYERGLSYSDGEYYEDALTDIDTAIKKRPDDQRWVNTYGMHFIDYFPHREKGIIYYFKKDYEKAEEELTLSMNQAPSSKASYFLDQVRIKRMLGQKKVISIPDINMSFPESTNGESVQITGIISDDSYVSKILVSNENYMIESSEKRILLNKVFYLPEGDHLIKIAAENLLGGKAAESIHIRVDRSGPIIIIASFYTRIRSERLSVRQIGNNLLYGEQSENASYS